MTDTGGAAIFDRALAYRDQYAVPKYSGGTVTMGARVPPEVQEAYKALADQSGAQPSDMIRAALFEYLERHRPEVLITEG